jgi:ATP-dependent RNA helicase RhlE
MQFSDLQLIEPLLRALSEEGYRAPTEIQAQAIPHVLAGRDLLGIAQTGTGKTAAFALPMLQLLATRPPTLPPGSGRPPIRALVITPTRELASQIGDSFRAYGRYLKLMGAVVYGGVGQTPQVQAISRGIDILVATPGRLLDLMQQGCVRLGHAEIVVLDEADRMLDMGFLPDVRRILSALPRPRQTLFFSATMAGAPAELARGILKDPARVEVTPQATTVERIRQSVVFVDKAAKQSLLERLLGDPALARTLVFTRTKHGADKVVQRLTRAGHQVAAIHANRSQSQRERALQAFRSGRLRVLVATDIAARGIDVDGITHVINFDLPNVPESYVHRIGRTARAGADGAAISFCDGTERSYLRDIEREIRMRIPTLEGGQEAAKDAQRTAHAAPAGPAAAGWDHPQVVRRDEPRRPQERPDDDRRPGPRPQGGRPRQGGRPQHAGQAHGRRPDAGQRHGGRTHGSRSHGEGVRRDDRGPAQPREGRVRADGTRPTPDGGPGQGPTSPIYQGPRPQGAARRSRRPRY